MFIVIEQHGGLEHAAIVTDPQTGTNMVFDTVEDAQKEADDCQDAVVFPDSVQKFNPDEICLKWHVEDVAMAALKMRKYITLSEARGILQRLASTHHEQGVTWDRIAIQIDMMLDERNWTKSIDHLPVDTFNTGDDALYFLYWILIIERLGDGFHWETPFTDYRSYGSLDGQEASTESYTPEQAAHRQAILSRVYDILKEFDGEQPESTIYTLCLMVNDTWEHVIDDVDTARMMLGLKGE